MNYQDAMRAPELLYKVYALTEILETVNNVPGAQMPVTPYSPAYTARILAKEIYEALCSAEGEKAETQSGLERYIRKVTADEVRAQRQSELEDAVDALTEAVRRATHDTF